MTAMFVPAEPLVRFLRTGLVRLEEPLRFVDSHGRVFRAPAGLVSDLESRPTVLPALLNGLLGPVRETAPAALIHDVLCEREGFPRATADALYHEMLLVLRDRDPLTSRLERARRRVGATVAWVGLRAHAWIRWIR